MRGGGGGAEKKIVLEHHRVGEAPICINYEPSLRSVLRCATAWAQKPCTEGVTFSGRLRPCV